MERMNFYGTPIVPTQEQRSVEFCLEGLLDAGLPKDRLQILRYALTENRQYSRYCHWTEVETASVLAFIDEHLPVKDRLPTWAEQAKEQEEFLARQAGKTITKQSKKPRGKTFTELPPAVPHELESFAASLPYRPYVSNDLEFGLRIVGRGTADLFRYIQPNPPCMRHWVVFDCDYPGALALAKQKKLPLPNLVAVNPENGNSHLFYQLRDAVCTSDMARMKPLNMLRRVQYAMTESLGADPSYGGNICKNPLNTHWETQKVHDKAWGLLDFKEFIEIPIRLPRKSSTVGLGRNCTIFEMVRREAYRCVLTFRLAGGQEAFTSHIHSLAVMENARFPEPLLANEVRAIAKSIATWVWRKYTGKLTDEAFSKRQAARGKLGGLSKGQANAEKRAQALLMAADGMSTREIGSALQVNHVTISRWIKAEA